MGYALAMSAEIRAWLDEVMAEDPAAAGAVGQALIALAELGPALGPPLVRTLPAGWRPGTDPREALDDAYAERLERLGVLRHGAAEAATVRTEVETRIAELQTPQAGHGTEGNDVAREAAELKALLPGLVRAEQRLTGACRRMQADTDMFRVRKETLKAAYTTAGVQGDLASLAGLLAQAGGALSGEVSGQVSGADSAAEAAARLAAAEFQIHQELAREAGPSRLLELHPGLPGEPGDDVSLIFAVEPAGTALIISVVQGDEAQRREWGRATEMAARVLRRVRAGQDPEASAVRFGDASAFAAAFVPAGTTTRPAGTAGTPATANGTGDVLPVPWLPFALLAEGQPPCRYQVLADTLELTGEPGSDLFIDPAHAGQSTGLSTGLSAGPAPDAGRLAGTPPPGDFTLSARVTVAFAARFDAGVLLVHAGERHWAKLCFELSPQLRPTVVTVVTRQDSDDCNSFEVTGDTVWLRISKIGAAWAFHASTDGAWWRMVRYFSLGAVPQARVGFLAQSPAGSGCTARFAGIEFRAGSPSGLRDGS